ncbi:DnaJ-domain-containing protein [Cylindrobasidium torrendii FP15055 ss-10]|uniref:DnaJ-domain-containing protein n=1 Tax=Cylindrobasidium torrendii FP15055 ss-10 TaxID=1314674 RepID=A0A0D7BF27_9AGAR|nr:DnaJ-domain-containing protein [Cylindrobasidium torrendii FP15055 ss-10]
MTTLIPSRPIQPHIQTTCSTCSSGFEFPVPEPRPAAGTRLEIRCWKCGSAEAHVFYPGQVPGASTSTATPPKTPTRRKGRGTQESPLETGYYDLLGVPVTATTEDIKKAYRRMAIKHHPDKNPSDPNAAERFNAIAIAYQTLSDPALRRKYNEQGPKESQPEGGFVDPEEVFSAIFGGEKFVSIIGNISLARDMKAALEEAEDAEVDAKRERDAKGRIILSEEEKKAKDEKERRVNAEKAAERSARIAKLVEQLTSKLSVFTEAASGPDDKEMLRSWKMTCELEAEDLKAESYGVDLLHAVGFVYASKAKHFLATHQSFLGVGGWLHNVQGKYHVFSETVSTLRSAIELKAMFDQIQAAEKAGLSPEEKKRLEEAAAEKGLHALFKGAKLEIESVLRETCDRVLEDPALAAAPTSGGRTTQAVAAASKSGSISSTRSLSPTGFAGNFASAVGFGSSTPAQSAAASEAAARAAAAAQRAELRAIGLQILGEAYMAVKKDGAEGAEADDFVKVETKESKARDSARERGERR